MEEKQYKRGKPGPKPGTRNNPLGANQYAEGKGKGETSKVITAKISLETYQQILEFGATSKFVREAIKEKLERMQLGLQ